MKLEYKISFKNGIASADISRDGIVFLSEGGGPSEREAREWARKIIEQVRAGMDKFYGISPEQLLEERSKLIVPD